MMDVMKDNLESDLMISFKSETMLREIEKYMFEEGNNSGMTHGLLVITRMINGTIEHRLASGVRPKTLYSTDDCSASLGIRVLLLVNYQQQCVYCTPISRSFIGYWRERPQRLFQ